MSLFALRKCSAASVPSEIVYLPCPFRRLMTEVYIHVARTKRWQRPAAGFTGLSCWRNLISITTAPGLVSVVAIVIVVVVVTMPALVAFYRDHRRPHDQLSLGSWAGRHVLFPWCSSSTSNPRHRVVDVVCFCLTVTGFPLRSARPSHRGT